MPTYEYECGKCGHRFDRMQRMSEKPLEECPRCQGKVRRLISGGAGVIVRGASHASHADENCGRCDSAESCPNQAPCSGACDE